MKHKMGENSHRFIKCRREDHIFWITLHRPEVLNALHPPSHEELDSAFDAFQEDPDLWIAILTGAGEKSFCVGNDLKFQATHGPEKVVMPKSGFGGITRRFDCNKPIIAAVNGIALGGGFEMALACDIIIAANNAVFGLPEPRVGMMARTGIHRLVRSIPSHVAMSMILTGRRITADEAARIGLVCEVIPRKHLETTALKWADEVLQCAPLAVRASKQAVRLGLQRDLETSLTSAYPLEEHMKHSHDFIEGPKAYVEKRKPEWKGR